MNTKHLRFFMASLFSFCCLATGSIVKAESKDQKPAPAPAAQTSAAPAPAAPSLISANGFACSDTGGQVSCHGVFKDLDKDITLTGMGKGPIVLQAQKGGDIYSYSSGTGCLCDANKKEIICKNSHGQEKKFKGDKMKEESSSYCSSKQ